MALGTMLKRLWGKAVVGGEWGVAYRLRSESDRPYRIAVTPEGTWAADPFIYEVDGEHYLFVELCERQKNKACIAYYKIIDGEAVFQQKIIEQPYHMSYPCVFEYNAEHYMIPETSANQTVELYRAKQFPTQWEKVKTLLSGERYVDTTVARHEDGYRAISYRKSQRGWVLDVFELDLERYAMKLLNSVQYVADVGRPAGNWIEDTGLFRPAQNCANKYGEGLIWYQVDRCTEDVYQEREVKKISVRDIPLSGKADRIHTYNRDSTYECVDVYREKIDLLHGAKTLWRAYLRNVFVRQRR